MKYDRDLRVYRVFVLAVMVLNAILGVLHLIGREWVLAGAFALWTVSLWCYLRATGYWQETREIQRMIEHRIIEWRREVEVLTRQARGPDAPPPPGAVKHWFN